MNSAAIVISLITLALAVLGLVVKITHFSTKIELYVREMRKERRAILLIPILAMRIGYLEQHLNIKAPQVSGANHIPEEDEDHED